MSFSQKHSGKVFVPWFNSSEWRYVYGLLTSTLDEEKKHALNILKIWKIRTPLLSAGVEGTLILLETLLSDVSNLSEPQTIQIYSISLMRFLNICAGNNERQGTFNRTASKNDLPKWLIDIRHDIAHSNKLPSKSMLEMALNYSLKWLTEKYWLIQNLTICDYYVDPEVNFNNKIVDSLKVYVKLINNLYCGEDIGEQYEPLMEKVNYFASKRYNTTKTDSKGLLLILEEVLKQALSDPDNKNAANKIAEILVSEDALLVPELEMNEEGIQMIPKPFKDLWSNLMNILYENGFLSALINELWECANNQPSQGEIAFLWITDILNGLLKNHSLVKGLQALSEKNGGELDLTTNKIILRSMWDGDNPEWKGCVEFVDENKLNLTDLRNIENKIMETPNIRNVKIFEKVLVLNDATEEYKSNALGIMKAICGIVTPKYSTTVSPIFSIKDFNININILNFDTSESNGLVTSIIDEDIVMTEEPEVKTKWQRVTDTSAYKDCPLGVLPHQNRDENPILIKNR